ncbi:MAG: hypothetical protein ACE5J4_02250 [Candidatus Aenigmatarchaeota archaeon]
MVEKMWIEEELVFAGVNCNEEENICKVWWLSTIKGKTHQVEVKAPIDIKSEIEERKLELKLTGLFGDSKAKIFIIDFGKYD